MAYEVLVVVLSASLWAMPSLAQATYEGSRGGGGPATSIRTHRPFDSSDREMQALMEALHGLGPCGRGPGQRCSEVEQRFSGGGDRLARQLVVQFEAGIREGYADRLTYLNYIAYTHSEVGFQFIADRVRSRADLSDDDAEAAIHALGRTSDARAIDELLRVLRDEVAHSRERSAAIRALVWTLERTGSRRDDAIRALRDLQSDPEVSYYVDKKLRELGVD
jgi:hypothetical protein